MFISTIKRILTSILTILLLNSCSSESEIIQFIVASKKIECEGIAVQKCLQVKTKHQKEWEFLYEPIIGFDYQEGFEYIINVKKEKISNPLEDESSIRYQMIKIISKTKK